MFEELKPGDKVVCRSNFGSHLDRIDTVERVTKTQIILQDGTRYTRRWGKKVGQVADRFHGKDRILIPTAADLLAHRRLLALEEARDLGRKLIQAKTPEEVARIHELLTWNCEELESLEREDAS